jgi:plastocyanin
MIIISAVAIVIALLSASTTTTTTTTTSVTAESVVKVQAGTGSGTLVAQTAFSPQVVQVKPGESVSWYNPTVSAPEPHTVTFVFDNKYMTDVVSPFAVPKSIQFMALPPGSNSQPTMGPPTQN